MTFKVVIIEDNDVTRVMLTKRVDECETLSVIASFADFNSAMNALDEITPDVLLVDLDLPDGSGIDIIRRESQRHPKLAIMVISVFADEVHVLQAIQAGARGYLLKDSDSVEIGDSIQQLLEGGSPISPSIARHLIKRFQTESEVEKINKDAITLSDREYEVLELASKGFSYAETAALLDISVNTVGSYTKRIYGKLEVNSRSEAVYEATQMGIMKSNNVYGD
ncbi:MAG: DNA-binding NarL/FixJ family response regulator [Enterobacterales bacterium]|jgi:DNA-binding NarL/FixJ family response regulator